MSGWRFYQLAEFRRSGVLVSPDKRRFAADFLTPERAKEKAQQQRALEQ